VAVSWTSTRTLPVSSTYAGTTPQPIGRPRQANRRLPRRAGCGVRGVGPSAQRPSGTHCYGAWAGTQDREGPPWTCPAGRVPERHPQRTEGRSGHRQGQGTGPVVGFSNYLLVVRYPSCTRIGLGGGAFGVRGGISNRGLGVGLGPLSVGTSWGRRRRRSSDGADGFLGFAITAVGLFLLVAWPYLLGTYIAVQAGAPNPSTARNAVGWLFEIVYLCCLIGGPIVWYVLTKEQRAQRAAGAEQRHAELMAEEAQRRADLIASGVVYETHAGRSVAYRHGRCTVNHRTWETAASCRNG
jgi:hypothetical protein